ncbi:hypothetical protein Slin15195_G101800 [Septoria linicola]|uniref:F-box domain-containing protein n=1 Tax=Septoria linicola TaxID=215465 RepID=A0A9Q9B5S9_9PEZI|nr:hypothetical protein Slin15195_G101800 [Septoria linicola]
MNASALMNLPAELRILIYEALFKYTECYLQIYKHHIQLCRYFSQCPPLPLLLTNKTVCKEVQNVLYGQTLSDIHLHMQQLPLTSIHDGQNSSKDTTASGCRQYKYGSMVSLQLPIKMQTFLWRVQRLQLNVWIYDAGKAEEMVKQIEAFHRSLRLDQVEAEAEMVARG